MRRWLAEVIVGLPLCPFAAPDFSSGRVRIEVSAARERDDAIRDGLREVAHLLEASRDETATTLLAFPAGFEDYETFLELAWSLEDQLEDADALEHVQIVVFHPHFRFGELADDDVAHFTNRAPVPLLHLLRQEDVTRVAETHPDIDRVPAENSARLEAMGVEAIRALWASL